MGLGTHTGQLRESRQNSERYIYIYILSIDRKCITCFFDSYHYRTKKIGFLGLQYAILGLHVLYYRTNQHVLHVLDVVLIIGHVRISIVLNILGLHVVEYVFFLQASDEFLKRP